jgi:phospholipid N-methyltransferase
MSSIFDSIKAWNIKPFRRMGVTIDEEIYFARSLSKDVEGVNPKNVIEIGGGNCLVSMILRNKIRSEIFSLDTWNEEISVDDVKKYTSGNVNLINNLFPLPFRKESVDLAYSILYFYNVPKAIRKNFAEELFNSIKKGGYFILAEPEIVRNMRKDFFSVGFEEVSYRSEQAVFFSKMIKN